MIAPTGRSCLTRASTGKFESLMALTIGDFQTGCVTAAPAGFPKGASQGYRAPCRMLGDPAAAPEFSQPLKEASEKWGDPGQELLKSELPRAEGRTPGWGSPAGSSCGEVIGLGEEEASPLLGRLPPGRSRQNDVLGGLRKSIFSPQRCVGERGEENARRARAGWETCSVPSPFAGRCGGRRPWERGGAKLVGLPSRR
ncbi:hypothetical protein CALCODRAFT_195558 [Calocera cornea HHB12733]|uniref:Uncharacterized protein n=1 Tax=Calocera cornea HHB12733 TaxID=1353952 RepID=A0A165HJ41_9BASI|nr:hypothetical protein CALCODRAFT_195558 [Calocera cornea HHB12733]